MERYVYTKQDRFSKQQTLSSTQLSKLHTFEAAARHVSFSLAAKELSVTPSAVSHKMTKLEEELGIALFHRVSRKISLTEEGERMYQSVRSTLFALNQELLDIKVGDISGTLTVYSRPSFAQCWLVPRLKDFNQRYPAIEIKILTGNETIHLKGYGIDVAIYFDDKKPSNLQCTDILSESVFPVCSPEYADQNDLFNCPRNLERVTLLHDDQAWDIDSGRSEWEEWASVNQVHLSSSSQSSMSFDRSDLALFAAMHHSGVAMGRKHLVRSMLDSGTLVAPFEGTEVACKQKYYAVNEPDNTPKKITLFLEWLKEQALHR
ncbi:HTH-type transcriptional regulator dsdC [Vibrio nigripulchritudo SFn27]|uniref:HTH-type transcriptional regulator dsdC n=1 Tax=Vibrio nigripulchritudo TaxID=28173 RepID=U4K4V7_9VIBR|nr:HTH-type transcriptional regulator dsdC [Vibrio nigripulchritudo BLFn1]CCN91365.1 HTH-type transcriptional regulator dsdC [Vibrio nigripulchritudo SFn27]CCN97530.1 HTH-type transcriptional regulator dsdC [Vibrio nigripulchritudo ENn2]CCO38672.1 HTH-type transcriptional regulator dsdC [Vibrio nigripulchritudo SFn135]CCO55077.1 HTH-type transcriptional regulator dsdC [Vibrio nigripulchritudo Wn13]CCO60317.1 HTH-type transcriptional regulator dsdC [Vibrio nigripulchritudo]